jgi:predicted MFS family arabinose efflux permease
MVILAYAHTALSMYLAAVVYAVGMAATQPALTALAVDRVGPERRGAAMGTFTAAFELGIGGGAITFGMLLSRMDYTVTFLGTAVVAFTGFLIFALNSITRVKN